MKTIHSAHWALAQIAEEQTPQAAINLWPQIELRLSAPGGRARKAGFPKKQWVYGLTVFVILVAALVFVPAARAFTENIFQRMGIAFVAAERPAQDVQVGTAQMMVVSNPPPSLSVAEAQAQLSFSLLLPTWLPEGLDYSRRSISEYDASTAGSGKELTVEYSRSADFEPGGGSLMFLANDGPISAPPLLAENRQQAVMVDGQPGIYVHGGWQNDGSGDPNTTLGSLQWDDQADNVYLTWSQGGVTYLLEAFDLGLQEEDMLRIAGSLAEP